MKTILIVCGNGLGSSFLIEMNVNKILDKLDVKANVSHTDLTTAKSTPADCYIGSKDIVGNLDDGSRKIYGLKNILDNNELESTLKDFFEK